MIFFNVTLNRLLIESFVIAKVAEESDNLLVNDKFVVPESHLQICRKETIINLTFECFSRLLFD